MVDEKFHFSNGEILNKETFLIFFFLDERTLYSKTNRKKTEVNIMSFTFCECVLMPSGIRSAVAVTTIIQLDLFFLKLKFSYVVLNKDHRLPIILWWALSQYGYHEWKHSKTLSLTSRTGIFVFSEKGTPAKSEHMAATQKLSIWFSCERKTLLQYSGDILYLVFQFPYLHNTKT